MFVIDFHRDRIIRALGFGPVNYFVVQATGLIEFVEKISMSEILDDWEHMSRQKQRAIKQNSSVTSVP